jgi:hypothetical protein
MTIMKMAFSSSGVHGTSDGVAYFRSWDMCHCTIDAELNTATQLCLYNTSFWNP